MKKLSDLNFSFSEFFLILSNCIPIIGVIFFDWSLYTILFLYWSESVIIGLYTIAKMIVTAGITGLFFAPFFILHFGAFVLVHLLFILGYYKLFGGFELTRQNLWALNFSLLPSFIALLISHGVSFFENFLGKKEYLKNQDYFSAPYRRVVVLHLTIMGAGFIVMFFKSPKYSIILLILLKIFYDRKYHKKEHARA